MRFFVAFTLAMIASGAATDLPPAIRRVVYLARSEPPELDADTLTRLVETNKISQKDLQLELLVDAFRAAAGAKEPVRLIAIQATPPDTRAIYRGKAGELRLDALSLQSRILKRILMLDHAKARELFDQLVHPAEDPRGCGDPLLPDLGPYYEAAGAIAQTGFSAPEKEKDVPVQFLLGVLSNVSTPAELPEFARAVQTVSLKPAQLELLIGAFSKTMESMNPYYRSFENSIESLQPEIETLTARTAAAHIGTEALVKGYRKFLVTQLTAARCTGNFTGAQQAIAWISAHTSPLTADDINPSKVDGTVKAAAYFQSADSQQLGTEMRQLSSGDRSTSDWRNQLADFLRDYSSWQPPGDEMDAFHQRATILRSLLGVVPAGEDRDRLVDLSAALLVGSNAERLAPAEWLWQAKTLLEAAGADAPKMLAAFRASGDPALVLYAGSGS